MLRQNSEKLQLASGQMRMHKPLHAQAAASGPLPKLLLPTVAFQTARAIGAQDTEAAGASEQQNKQQQPDAESPLNAHKGSPEADGHCKEHQAARDQVRAECTKQHLLELQQLQQTFEKDKADLIKGYQAQLALAAGMKQQRQADSNQFQNIVRGIQEASMSGWVPCQIFEAEPDSLLNRLYNGDWEHARDNQGRAVINSDPGHWPLILNWLSFGAVPPSPSPAFITVCKYWQLTNLLDTIQQSAAAVAAAAEVQSIQEESEGKHSFSVSSIVRGGRPGFSLAGVIHRFKRHLYALGKSRWSPDTQIGIAFEAYGQAWNLLISDVGLCMQLCSSPSRKSCQLEVGFGPETSCYKAIEADCDFDFKAEDEDHDLFESPSGMLWSKAPADDWLGATGERDSIDRAAGTSVCGPAWRSAAPCDGALCQESRQMSGRAEHAVRSPCMLCWQDPGNLLKLSIALAPYQPVVFRALCCSW